MRLAAAVFCLFASAAAANAAVTTEAGFTKDLTIDLRSAPWSGAHGQTSFAVDQLTVAAFRNLQTAGKIYQDGVDGVGVQGGEQDEIDGHEIMRFTFAAPSEVTAIMFSDLFRAPDGGQLGERAVVKLEMQSGATHDLIAYGNLAHQQNGEATLSFAHLVDGDLVRAIVFGATGLRNDDYSVAGLHVTPLPGAVWALGAGIAGLVGLRRRARRT